MYVARDKDGTLCVFFNKPVKSDIWGDMAITYRLSP
jgi:hypothetical protein